MQVSQTELLALANIAKLWAAELRDTPLEEHPDMLLTRLRSALIEGELNPADSTDVSQKEFYKLIVSSNVSYVPPESAIRLHGEMNQVKISRPEFLRWVQVQGRPLPKFWDGSQPASRRTTSEMALEYREHHKKYGIDPDDPDTKAPAAKGDIAAMKRMFPGVPEKTLQAIRKGVWMSRIKPGRPRKTR
jgi:hypothetical protein